MRILLLFLLTSLSLSAQHEYQFFQPGVQYLFDNPDTIRFDWATKDTQYYGAKVDSAGCQEMYGSMRYIDEAVHRLPSPFGYGICQEGDSTRMLFDSTSHLLLLTKGAAGRRWIAFRNDTLTVEATVTSIELTDFFGLTDSVKTIAFSRQDGSSLGTTRISKQYGLIEGRFFYDLTQPDPLPLAGLSSPEVGVQLPPPAAYSTLRVGDVLHATTQTRRSLSPDGDDVWNVFEKQMIEVVSVDSITAGEFGTRYLNYTARASIFEYKLFHRDPTRGRDSSLVLDTLVAMQRRLLPDSVNRLQPGARYLTDVIFPHHHGDSLSYTWEMFKTIALFEGPCGLMMKRPTVDQYIRVGVDMETEYPCVDCYGWDQVYAPYLPLRLEFVGQWGTDGLRVTPQYIDTEEVTCGTPFDFSDIIISTDDRFLSEFDRRLRIFPNPVDAWLTIEFPDKAEVYRLTLIDSRGVSVRQQHGTRVRARMDVEGLPTGVYVLLVMDKRQLVGRRRVVVR
jgi:hypothetical protein